LGELLGAQSIRTEDSSHTIIEEPTKVTPYKYEFFSVNVDKEPAGLEFSVEGE